MADNNHDNLNYEDVNIDTTGENVNLLYEKLKLKEETENAAKAAEEGDQPMRLDDASRVKVLSPSRLVAKRFFRNKLAMVGLIILIILFTLCFLGPLFYPYKQTQKFTGINDIEREYAVCGEPTSFVRYFLNTDEKDDVRNYVDSYIKDFEDNGGAAIQRKNAATGDIFEVRKLGEDVYVLYLVGGKLCSVDRFTNEVTTGELPAEHKSQIIAAITNAQRGDSKLELTLDGHTYSIELVSKGTANVYSLFPEGDPRIVPGILASKLVFDSHNAGETLNEEFQVAALTALYDTKEFTIDGKKYTIDTSGEEDLIKDEAGTVTAGISQYAIRSREGKDSFDIEFKSTLVAEVETMIDKNERDASFEYSVPQLNNEGQYDRDEAGNIVLVPETLNIERKEVAGEVRYHVSYNQRTEVWSLFERPSWKHLLGTDGDSYDVIARIMYGGRISLLVGFVVVFLETILGVLMGGLAGFFGGWVDTLIMRLVDIFYCIPTMPIMIILASVFDQQQVKPYIRLLWMMVVLGILGWSGIARLVRGQILSLREQEFMTAAEATGLKTGRRIFKHLVPNVMPQLIVSMTMGLGGVILLESTLSYLGLGVKHPYATWGNMINSVSDIESMKSYTYIWIPVGVLICLAVIAFNFVGDGLRDAFDPKMKR